MTTTGEVRLPHYEEKIMTILRNLLYGTAVVVLVLIGTALGMTLEDE